MKRTTKGRRQATVIPPSLQHTKILCTLGPATATMERIQQLIVAGADAIRLNFSHSRHETHRELFTMVRAASAAIGRHVPIIQDLQGPKIRVGIIPGGPTLLRPATEVVLTVDAVAMGDTRIPIGYRRLANDVLPGDTIFLDDGLIRLRVERKRGPDVYCTVINGGLLKDNKGVNLPGVNVSEPSLTAKDRRDLAFGLELGVDYVALSFVRSAADILSLKRVIRSRGCNTPVIAKIEKVEAVNELDAVIAAADAVMVARGDLGVEMPGYDVPLVQKRIIRRCNERGVPVIVATQMLESMISNPRPTRAEASDVANAVIDGTDVVMLSAETSVGAYPVETVAIMNDIIRSTEASIAFKPTVREHLLFADETTRNVAAMAGASAQLAAATSARAILCQTYSGETARLLSLQRPGVPIIALTSDETICRRLGLYSGIFSVVMEQPTTAEEAMMMMREAALRARVVAEGDLCLFTTGYPVAEKAATNMIVLRRV